jgi:hypothetical protein
MTIDDIVLKLIAYYDEQCTEQHAVAEQNNAGGRLRSKRGQMVESISKMVWNLTAEMLNINIQIQQGKDDMVEIVSPNGYIKKHQTDTHVKFNNKLICVTECKSYVDSCYYERACSDCKLFKIYDPNIQCIVLAIEDSLSENTMNFYDDVFNKPVDKVFFLADGKRSSSKAIYKKEYSKRLNHESVKNYVMYVFNLLSTLQCEDAVSKIHLQ